MDQPRVLIVDDEPSVRESLRLILKDRATITLADCGEAALTNLEQHRFDVVLLDILMPGLDGLEVLERLRARSACPQVIMLTATKTVKTAVRAMRLGAFDYVTKPFEKLDLTARIHRAMRISEILFRYEPPQRSEGVQFKELVGVSPAFQNVTAMISAAARVQSTTLIIGETGTGKELIARAIHDLSAERNGPFQVVDCTTFSEGTVESELFGHVRGAFTGAVGDKLGLIERGTGGTLFLDEIGDLPLPLQAKLLRVLEEGEMRAVGSVQMKKVSARFIAATNQELTEKVRKNEFRKDLFFRLNVMAIKVPPLRERTEDIPLLARHFVARYSKEFSKNVKELHPSAVTELVAYPWPGNVRELRNVIERAVMLAKGDRISPHDVIGLLQFNDQARRNAADDYLSLPYAKAKEKIVEEFSRRYIQNKLDLHQGNVTHAAQEAGLPRPYFHEIMRRYLKDER